MVLKAMFQKQIPDVINECTTISQCLFVLLQIFHHDFPLLNQAF